MKINRKKGNSFSSRVAVYQPSLFDEENVTVSLPSPLPGGDAQAIQELNALVTAQYEMSKLERRIFIKALEYLPVSLRQTEGFSMVDPVLLPQAELVQGLDIKTADQSEELERAVHKLIRHVCWINDENGPIQVGLFSSVQHLKGKGLLKIGIDPLVYPYLMKIKDFFGLAQLETLIGFKSFYSKCLYELFRKTLLTPSGLYFTLPQLKSILLIEPLEYERFSDLKRFVLERTQRDLAGTYLAFSFAEKRMANGKVLGVQFTFHNLKSKMNDHNP